MHGRVLLFSVDSDVRWLGVRTLRGLGLEVDHTETWEKAQRLLDGARYDLFFFGPDHFALPKVENVVRHLLRVQPRVGPIFITTGKTEHYIPLLRQIPELRHVVAKQPGLCAQDFSSLARKLLGGDLLGLDKYLDPHVEVRELRIDDSTKKNDYIGSAVAFAREITDDDNVVTGVETIADELVMNALFDAPITDVKPRNLHLRRDQPVQLAPDEAAHLRFACDGTHIFLSVADPFGSLSLQTLLQHIEIRLAGISEPINESGGGGFGLFTAYQNSSRFVLDVLPGRCTEVITSIDLTQPFRETKRLAKSLHLFTDQ